MAAISVEKTGSKGHFLLFIFLKSEIRHVPNSLRLSFYTLLSLALVATVSLSSAAQATFISFPATGPTVLGNKALLRGSQACAPQNAPLPVKRAIWAANQLHTKPYRFGGGHHSFSDNAYDCSGTVSYM